MTLQSVGIVGAGAWGTALGIVARRAGRDVLIWAHEATTVVDINQKCLSPLVLLFRFRRIVITFHSLRIGVTGHSLFLDDRPVREWVVIL